MNRKQRRAEKSSKALKPNTLASNHQKLFMEGLRLHQAGQLSDAERKYREILSADPNHVDSLHLLGVLANHNGNSDLAVELIRKALHLKPDFAEAYNNLSNTLKRQGKLDDAVACLRKAVALKPDFAEAHSNLGNTLTTLGELDEAVICFDTALNLKPNLPEVHNNLGIAWRDLGKPDKAVISLQKALELRPGYPEAYNNLGLALRDLGKVSESGVCFRRAIENMANYPDAHNNLGTTLRDMGKFDEAVVNFRKALNLKPDFPGALKNLGNALSKLGQLSEAVSCLRRAVEITPNLAAAHYDLGIILCYLNEAESAVIEFQKAFSIDPTNEGLNAIVYAAVLFYLNGNTNQSNSCIVASQSIISKTEPKFQNAQVYWHHLHYLLSLNESSHRKRIETRPGHTIHVIGDSHSLALHGLVVLHQKREMVCSSHLIIGCKQWHLGSPEPNEFKHQFNLLMAMLPRESLILLTIGEIDCRYNEGIFKLWKKHPERKLDQLIHSTVGSYIAYVATAAARFGHKIIIGGVPAINTPLDLLPAATAEEYIDLVREFNATLRKMAVIEGMGHLDVYSLTDRGDGITNGKWHVDSAHLSPSALVEAFARHGIAPTSSTATLVGNS